MAFQQTSLDFVPAAEHARHVPACVLQHLTPEVRIFLVDDTASDTAQFSERYGFGLEDCANTIVLRYRKGGADHYAALVTLGSRRLDVNGAVKAQLGAQRLSFAKREDAVELTGMEFGGITAFGVPGGWTILIDQAVMERPQVVMGAGVRVAKLLLAPAVLLSLPGVQVAGIATGIPSEV